MKRYIFSLGIFLLFAAFWGISLSTAKTGMDKQKESSSTRFVQNKGQWEGDFSYRLDLHGGKFFASPTHFSFLFVEDAYFSDHAHPHHGEKEQLGKKYKAHAYRVNFVGANPQATIAGNDAFPDYNNYFLGNNPEKWASQVPIFGKLHYQNLYSNIAMDVYGVEKNLKYDLLVAPGGNPAQVQLQYEGAEISLKEGNLVIKTSVNEITEMAPYAYQIREGKTVEVPCKYRLEGQILSYEFPESYDKNLELVIDPSLVFSTFTGSSLDNWGFTATYDDSGNLYGGGIAFDGWGNYPTTTGAFDVTHNGDFDAAITKFNSSGNALLYSTFIGGNNEDQPHSMIVDPNGDLLIMGRTNSTNFPTSSTGFDRTANGDYDIYVLKLNPNGNSLLGSTYLGGSNEDGVNMQADYNQHLPLKYNYGDDSRGEVMIDDLGNVYIASCTKSTNFPVLGAFQSSKSSQQDGVVVKLNSDLSALVWSSYIGGSGQDAAYSIKVDNAYNAYVAGGTSSNNFPTTAGTLDPAFRGQTDGFIAKINASGASIAKCSYIGTSAYDQIFFVELDKYNNVYVFGQTEGSFPINGSVYSNSGGKQFVAKLDNNLSNYIYSTRVGSSSSFPNISPTAFLVDRCENVYLAGWGGSTNFQGATNGMPISSNAYQSTTDGDNFHVMVLEKGAIGLLYGTYFGGLGASAEHVDGGTSRFDRQGIIYGAVCAACGGSNDFPTTPGAWSNTNGSSNCNLGVFKIKLDLGVMFADYSPTSNGAPIPSTGGCAPLSVLFDNNSTGIITPTYTWDFGDGSPTSNQFQPTHTYTNPGTYTATLIIYDPATCNERDTVIRTITVNTPPTANAGPVQTICPGQSVQLTGSGGGNYQWNPWTSLSGANTANPTASPTSTTIYTLTVTDANGCTDTDTVTVFVNTALQVDAGSSVNICNGSSTTLSSTPNQTGTYTYNWSPATGLNATNVANPVASPSSTTTYTLTITNSQGCTATDQVTVNVFEIFTLQDTAMCYGESIVLTTTGNAVSYNWSPSTGLSATNVASPIASPDQTITYTVTAVDAAGCISTKSLEVVVNPLPTADAGADALICQGEGFQLQASGGLTYFWSPSTGLNNPNIANPMASPNDTTTYTVTVVDANGCSDTDQVTLNVAQRPTVTGLPPQSICEGDSVQLMALGALTYQWTGPNVSNPNASITYVRPTQTTTYQVIGWDANGCKDTATTTVYVVPTPITNISGVNEVCIGGSVILSASGGTRYIWSTGDTTQNIYIIPTGPQWYYCTASIGNCTGIMDSIFVDVNFDHPQALFEATPDTAFAPATIQFTNLSTGSYSYLWDFGTRGENDASDEINPSFTYGSAGTYMVTLISSSYSGCPDTFQLPITILNTNLSVPSAFTPNGDNFNDQFFVGYYGVENLNIQIYSRWGMKVFESDNKDFRWDGRYEGQDVPEGVYVWSVQATTESGVRIHQEGTVTILR